MAVTATAVLVTADDATYTTSRCVIPARLRLETDTLCANSRHPKGENGGVAGGGFGVGRSVALGRALPLIQRRDRKMRLVAQ